MTFPAPRSLGRALQFALLLAPVAGFAFVIAHHATDLPRDDDTFSILPFLVQWTDSPAWSTRFGLLFEQYFSHRIVLTKCAAAAVLSLAGYCDFVLLQSLGWLAWLGVSALLLHASARVRLTPWCGLPVMLILMQPQGATNFLIAMQAVQNLGVLVISFGALTFCLRPGRLTFAASLALAFLAPLASVNGLLVFPIAAAGLALLGLRYRSLAFAISGAVVWAAFFLSYSNPQSPFQVLEFGQNAAVMIGAPLMFGTLGIGFATIAGGVVLLAAAVILLASVWRRGPPALALFLLFVTLSVAMAARGRIGWGPDYMEQDRYRVYGLLALALLYLLLLDRVPVARQRPAVAGALVAAAGFCFLSYAGHLPRVTTQFRWTQAMALNRQLERDYFKSTTALWPEAQIQWRASLARGLIRPPAPLSTADLAFITELNRPTPEGTLEFSATATSSFCGYGLTAAPVPGKAPPDFAVMLRDGRPLVLPVDIFRSRLAELASERSFYSDRFQVLLPELLHRSGSHPLFGLARQANGNLAVLWQGRASLP